MVAEELARTYTQLEQISGGARPTILRSSVPSPHLEKDRFSLELFLVSWIEWQVYRQQI